MDGDFTEYSIEGAVPLSKKEREDKMACEKQHRLRNKAVLRSKYGSVTSQTRALGLSDFSLKLWDNSTCSVFVVGEIKRDKAQEMSPSLSGMEFMPSEYTSYALWTHYSPLPPFDFPASKKKITEVSTDPYSRLRSGRDRNMLLWKYLGFLTSSVPWDIHSHEKNKTIPSIKDCTYRMPSVVSGRPFPTLLTWTNDINKLSSIFSHLFIIQIIPVP